MHASPSSSCDPQVLTSARELLASYDVLFCDIWGVLHDGVRAFDASNDALTRYRAGGGTVILVSNAPAPTSGVERTLAEKGVQRGAWDAIVSSGALALDFIRAQAFERIHRIGPSGRDSAFFSALAMPHAPLDACDAIACTGLADDRSETGESYRARLSAAAQHNIPFVCANPDLVVHVGDRMYPCAGAIGIVYESMGGPVVWCGKPHASAYVRAFECAATIRGAKTPRGRVLAIGDAVRTDLAGAQAAGIDALFVTSGIHRDEVMAGCAIDRAALLGVLEAAGISAIAATTALAW